MLSATVENGGAGDGARTVADRTTHRMSERAHSRQSTYLIAFLAKTYILDPLNGMSQRPEMASPRRIIAQNA